MTLTQTDPSSTFSLTGFAVMLPYATDDLKCSQQTTATSSLVIRNQQKDKETHLKNTLVI